MTELNQPFEDTTELGDLKISVSVKGRVRRTTDWITFFICGFTSYIITEAVDYVLAEGGLLFIVLLFMPLYWVCFAVVVKRATIWNTRVVGS